MAKIVIQAEQALINAVKVYMKESFKQDVKHSTFTEALTCFVGKCSYWIEDDFDMLCNFSDELEHLEPVITEEDDDEDCWTHKEISIIIEHKSGVRFSFDARGGKDDNVNDDWDVSDFYINTIKK